ncbi:hypothetical protein [Acidipropionibacterium timonense]|uniref:hypothetical protein n=1 Tax=Acidipropionibacterium timonense TaxID=2161818 RepID=UPI0010302004|nr:hypothetical protein [Acidipropionibacterium timonense]
MSEPQQPPRRAVPQPPGSYPQQGPHAPQGPYPQHGPYGPQTHPGGYLMPPRNPLAPPGVLLAVELVVGIAGALWMLIILALWVSAGRSTSGLGPMTTSFALSLAGGDWVLYLLVPTAGFVLSMTMRRGHAIDRWLFTILGAFWIMWLLSHVQAIRWPGVLLVGAGILLAWTPAMNAWIAAVAAHEQAMVNPLPPPQPPSSSACSGAQPWGRHPSDDPSSWPPPSPGQDR